MTWSDATKTKENNIDTYLSAPFSIGGLEQEIVAGFMYNQAQKTHGIQVILKLHQMRYLILITRMYRY